MCVCTFFIIITILLHCTLGSYGAPPRKRSSRWLENGSSPKSSVELAGNRFASRDGQTVRQDDREKLTGRCLAIGRGSHCNERIQSLSPLPVGEFARAAVARMAAENFWRTRPLLLHVKVWRFGPVICHPPCPRESALQHRLVPAMAWRIISSHYALIVNHP